MIGLPCRFAIVKGKFQLSGGSQKVADDIWFYAIYDRFRAYTSDYGANFVQLVQKPVSSLLRNKTIILGTLQKGIEKYVPQATIRSIDVGYLASNRQEYILQVRYSAKTNEPKTVTEDVVFV